MWFAYGAVAFAIGVVFALQAVLRILTGQESILAVAPPAWRSPLCSVPCAGRCRLSWTAASTVGSTTPPRRSQPSTPGCARRQTLTSSATTWLGWPGAPCSQSTPPCAVPRYVLRGAASLTSPYPPEGVGYGSWELIRQSAESHARRNRNQRFGPPMHCTLPQ